MKQSLAVRAFTKFGAGLLLCGLLLFLPAGTLRWFGGWLFLGVLFLPIPLCSSGGSAQRRSRGHRSASSPQVR